MLKAFTKHLNLKMIFELGLPKDANSDENSKDLESFVKDLNKSAFRLVFRSANQLMSHFWTQVPFKCLFYNFDNLFL